MPAPVTCLPGSASGACCAGPRSPWPPPFPPPPPVARLCSAVSSVLWRLQTSPPRASSATALRTFPMRTALFPGAAGREISRFPCEELPCVHGVCDLSSGRFGPSPERARPCGLPQCPTGSAPRMCILIRLNTQPPCNPVNASPTPSRVSTHDSGPMWMANPSRQGTCTLYSSPVSRRSGQYTIFRRHRRVAAENGILSPSVAPPIAVTGLSFVRGRGVWG